MATISQTLGARTAFAGLTSALVSATYDSATVIDLGATTPLDCIIEVEASVTSPSGNKQIKVFVQESLDNSNFSSGPTSSTTTTDEPDLYLIGIVPCNNASATTHRKAFSVASALGFCPRYIKLVRLNDTGVTLTSSAAYYSTVVGTSA